MPFLQWAKTKGANKTANGLGMLIEQAVRPFELWTGKTPDTQLVSAGIASAMSGLRKGDLWKR